MKIGIPPEPQREIAPAGSHYGVCCTVCDLGTQKSPYGVKRQLYLAWELPEEKTSKGKPHVLGKFYNLTGNERGTLRQDLESWYGKHFSKEEIAELDLIEALLGRTATIGVMHAAPQGGRLRAQITSVMLPPRGKPPKTMPMTAPIAFGFEGDFDRHAYEALPEWLKSIISRSLEYQRLVNEGEDQGTTDERLKRRLDKDDYNDLDDALPF